MSNKIRNTILVIPHRIDCSDCYRRVCMVHVQTTKRVDLITARCSISTIIHLFYDSKSREERKMTFK